MPVNKCDPRAKFQTLLRELFQLESAKDLDFGIYRVLNYRRDVVERFIETDLLDAVNAELARGAIAEQTLAARELKALATKVRADLGDAALDASGVLADAYHGIPLGSKYLQLFDLARGAKPRPEVEATIFNQLYEFFSRYYDAGDFLTKRRYSKREKYAIPYNGEEVYLHWANRDQYYVKTAEHFTDYSFRTPGGIAVHFKLRAADVEKDNVKGGKRFFVPIVGDATLDAVAAEVVIPFEYRPLTAHEDIKYGSRNQQDAIIVEAVDAIPKHFSRDAVAAAAVTDVGRHLHRYTARNTSDYFIHKDLKGFLERELDFYLKNEVLNVDELEAGGEAHADAWFQQLSVMKAVGRKVIAFLAQIEDFQKLLFEKKKFVLETQYCVTVQNIPEAFYAEISANDAQWLEWRDLFHIDEEEKKLFNGNAKSKTERRVAFLKSNPTLVLDTKYFGADFCDRLLANYEDLDAIIDGLLVRGENFQALKVLSEKYQGAVKCVYIDPPFNTGTDFLYKDSFRNSSWLALLVDRIHTSQVFLNMDTNYFMHLDENSVHYGKIIMAAIFGELHELIFNTNATKDEESGLFSYKSFGRKFVRQHDTILHGYWSNKNFVKLWKPNRRDSKLGLGQLDLLSKSSKPNPQRIEDFDFYVERYENNQLIQYPLDITDEKIYPIGDIWNDIYSFTQSEMRTSENLSFLTQKPEHLIRRIVQSSTVPGDIILDFFAGSGTTPAVCHKLRRRYIAVEMADYFKETYDDYDRETKTWLKKAGLLGRMKNVLYGDISFYAADKERRSSLSKQIGWQGGGIFKCINLESYDDALNNVAFDDAAAQSAMAFDDYVLKYMLSWETKHSATFLSVAQLEDPFNYKLLVAEDGLMAEKAVDLAETFNYLLGLNVATRRVYDDDGHKYLVYRGETRDGRAVAVIWRATKGWTQTDYERDRVFVAAERMADDADDVFVNGDSAIPGARSLDPVFKARMFTPLDAGNGGT